MAGNSRRRGAVSGRGKNPKVGSGGWGRKKLEGRGPTPKAADRPYHKSYRGAASSDASGPRRASRNEGGRTARDREFVAGRNAVLEVLKAGTPVTSVRIALRMEMDDRVRDIVAITAERGTSVLEVGKSELDRLTDGAAHQGILAEVPAYDYLDPEDLLDAAAISRRAPLVVALDGVTDPHNLGAVLRSAGAFGAHGVLVPRRRSAGVTATVWKVSAGAAARVPVARATNLVRTLQEYKKAGLFVVGLDGGGETNIESLPFASDPLVLVVGSEGKGLSRLVRETCDAIASIAIASSVESLNAAVASGVALHEVARQRRTP